MNLELDWKVLLESPVSLMENQSAGYLDFCLEELEACHDLTKGLDLANLELLV